VSESAFEIKKAKIEAFKLVLKELMLSHNVGMDEMDNFDSEENYVSTNYYFTIDSEAWFVETIDEILNQIISDKT
jgi:hypothetical protein